MRGESRRGRGKGRGAGVGLFQYHFLELFSNPLLLMSNWHRTAQFYLRFFYGKRPLHEVVVSCSTTNLFIDSRIFYYYEKATLLELVL